MNRSGSWPTWGCAVLLLALSSSAAAKATLIARLTNATCLLGTGSTVVSVECSPLPDFGNAIGFDAVVPRGGSASVTATLVYTYSDDGLPLEDYGVLYPDANAFTWEMTYFEAGALYATSNSCEGSRYRASDPTVFIVGSTGFPPILLGLNTVADRVTGSIGLQHLCDPAVSVRVVPRYRVCRLERRDLFRCRARAQRVPANGRGPRTAPRVTRRSQAGREGVLQAQRDGDVVLRDGIARAVNAHTLQA